MKIGKGELYVRPGPRSESCLQKDNLVSGASIPPKRSRSVKFRTNFPLELVASLPCLPCTCGSLASVSATFLRSLVIGIEVLTFVGLRTVMVEIHVLGESVVCTDV